MVGLALTYFFVYVVRQGVTSWFVFYLLQVTPAFSLIFSALADWLFEGAAPAPAWRLAASVFHSSAGGGSDASAACMPRTSSPPSVGFLV